MTRSSSELGVILRPGSNPRACAQRLAADGCGNLMDVETAPDAPVKILRVPDVSMVRRNRILGDTDVVETRPVFRFEGDDSPVLTTGQINLRVRPELTDAEINALLDDFDIEVVDEVAEIPGVFRVVPRDPTHDEILRARNLAADARVLWAQPNLRRPPRKRQVSILDTYYDRQWSLNNTGQAGGRADADIDAPEAWLLADGQGILIGMFDDSCDVDHEDLRDGYIGIGHDPSLPSNDPGFTDPRPKQIGDQHGTAVMGLAVARANQLGIRGVSFLSRFTASRGFGNILTDFDIASVFTFARQQSVDVHLNSWGISGPNSSVIEDAIRLAFQQGRPVPQQPGSTPGDDSQTQPARGMVIVWASGNDGVELMPGFDYSMMPEVIGVGATTSNDELAIYSNYGTNITVVAPGGETETDALITTDNEDRVGRPDNGYNVGGSELDAAGRYTNSFVGTSAACPITAGVAALVLSVNDMLTANDVRLILQHTADRIDEANAQYHPITSRSVRYGYGRINARRAVVAAQESLNNGGLTWPERPYNVRIESGQLRWQTSVGTSEFLVIESDLDFEFAAQDGRCYDARQLGCSSSPITSLPGNTRVNTVISCARGCEFQSDQSVIADTTGQLRYAIFARNTLGRYSFGVAIDEVGVVTDPGPVIGTVSGDTGGGTDGTVQAPRVTISAAPLEGQSPLTVQFMGNAVSARPIDESRTSWDFDIDTLPDTNATTRNASWTYIVEGSESRTFVARLTMYDIDGRSGSATVMIRVRGTEVTDGGTPTEADLRIIIGRPGSPDSDESAGTSPWSVELSVDARSMPGTLQSILWDLGDGSTARSLIVPHTYINTTTSDLVIPITATVNMLTTGNIVLTSSTTRLATVRPGTGLPPTNTNDNVCFAGPDICNPNGGSGGGGGCFSVGLLPLGSIFLGLFLFRRRFR